MRHTILAVLMAMTGLTMQAQTMNVVTGSTTYQFPAALAGDMTYSDGGTKLTINGKTFTVSDITSMYVDESKVSDSTVTVAYDGTTAAIVITGDIAKDITATVSGAHVTLTQGTGINNGAGEVEYVLSGATTDGEFALAGSYKCTVQLAGLTLTNPSGAAINITNSKRIKLSAKKNTVNTLTDGANGAQKACLYSKGQLQLQGNGTLNVVGNTKHAVKSGDYITVKNLTLNITSAVGDGISCEEYFQQKSGTITISGVGDDGIQCDLGGTTSTGETDDHDDEDSGNVYIEGGTLNISVTATAAKGVKADGDLKICGGDITIATTGNGKWDEDDQKTKAAACMSADGNVSISGGTMTLTSQGHGGKGISGDGTLTITGSPVISISTAGGVVAYVSNTLYNGYTGNTDRLDSDYKSSAKGIKADGAISISGGTIYVKTTGINAEGIESKSTMQISDGNITVESYDDGLNAKSDLTISGGYVYARATKNDGIDANGNCYIKGGVIYAIGSGSPEVAIDANSEEQKKLYISGGTVIAVGGLESGASITNGTCKATSSWTANSWHALYNGGTLVAAFKTPAQSSTSGGGGFRPGGGGGGSQQLVVYTSSTPTLQSGVSVSGGTEYWNGMGIIGGTVSGGSAVTLSNYSSGGGGGPRW